MKYKISFEKDSCSLILSGNIDESAGNSFRIIVTEMKKRDAKVVNIDCQEVYALNSVGASAWFHFVNEIDSEIQLRYQNCPQVMIDTAELINGFFGHGKIESFIVNYFCGGCSIRGTQSFSAEDTMKFEEFPAVGCPKCSASMPAEADREQVQKFL